MPAFRIGASGRQSLVITWTGNTRKKRLLRGAQAVRNRSWGRIRTLSPHHLFGLRNPLMLKTSRESPGTKAGSESRIKGSARGRRSKPVAADRLGDDTVGKAGDQRPSLGDRFLDRRQGERRFVARLAVPNFSNPYGVRICRVLGHNVAKAPGHACHAHQDRDQPVPLPRNCVHLRNQSVHAYTSRREGPPGRHHRGRRNHADRDEVSSCHHHALATLTRY